MSNSTPRLLNAQPKRQRFAVSLARAALFASATLVAGAALVSTVANADENKVAERWERAERPRFVKLVDEACKAVVSIQGEKQYEVGKRALGRDSQTQYDVFNGMGTGVVIDERGYVVTNYHVVKGLLKLEVVTSDGERYNDVELIRNDVATDLAILKIKPKRPLHKIRMGRSERVMLAEDVYAIGNPYGYDCSVSHGIISALNRPLEVNENLYYDRVIQTDAAINPGNSGGPLVNIDGEMIGLNAAVREEAENIAFAIPIDVVAKVAERMIRQSVAKMTHHGLRFRVVDSDMPDYPEIGNGEDCLVVESVDPRSPAEECGVKPGDVLLSSNGYRVRSSLDFTCSLIGLGLTDVADLEFSRDGAELETALAFNGAPSNVSRTTSVAANAKEASASLSTDDEPRYQTASTNVSFAESAEIVPTSEKRPAATTKPRGNAAQRVWDVFGLEVETVTAEEYRKLFPNLKLVSIEYKTDSGENATFVFDPVGGVNVSRVDKSGLLASSDVGITEGDFIFGFGVGNDQDGQLSVASLENLYYIAKRVDEYAKVDSGRARVYLIRDGKPYFLEIDLNNR